MKQGVDKRWFVSQTKPLVSRGIYFALPSAIIAMVFGFIGMFLVALDPHNPESGIETYLMVTALPILLSGYIFAWFEPDWMSPDWFRWLKQEHGDILNLLEREADELGREKWFPMVETQEGLETWVAEVRRKHGLNEDWIEYIK
jgi:hypothetical protein